jgi:hypothetical protein
MCLWWSARSSSSPSPSWDSCDLRWAVSLLVFVVYGRRVRFVVVLSSTVVRSRIASNLGISIVAAIDHLVVKSIVSLYRRRADCGVVVSGCPGILRVRARGDLLPSDLRGWPLWPFLKGILACGGRQCASIVPPLGAACGFGVSFATCDLRQGEESWKRDPKVALYTGFLRRNVAFTSGCMCMYGS